MDPASAAIVLSVFQSLSSPIIDEIRSEIKHKRDIKFNDLRQAIDEAYQIASQKSLNAVEQLNNRLMSLPLISKSPVLKSVVEKLYKDIGIKLKREKEKALRNDIDYQIASAKIDAQQDDPAPTLGKVFDKLGVTRTFSQIPQNINKGGLTQNVERKI